MEVLWLYAYGANECALGPAWSIKRLVIEPNRTQSLDWVRLGSAIELYRTHKKILPIKRNRMFSNRTLQPSNKTELN